MAASDIAKFLSELNECVQNLYVSEKYYLAKEKFVPAFKNFLKSLSACLFEINKNGNMMRNCKNKNKVYLCLSQVSKCLKLFSFLFSKAPCRQSIWYVCERVRWCATELHHVFSDPDAAEDCDSDTPGSFMHGIDQALQLLDSQLLENLSAWNPLANDLVCQAITIAKIATHTDYKEITSACHKLLEESSQLLGVLENDSKPSLITDSLSANVIVLEHRVNLAVLRLMLQVFSEPNKPLKKIVRTCGQGAKLRTVGDLDHLITDLDVHIERIILISQFALSCCEDTNRTAGIRCCLASLESVDNYLVPALRAFYLSPDCQLKESFVQFLCEHWQDELTRLYRYLVAMVDTRAFSQVVQESMSDLSERLCQEESINNVGHTMAKQGWLLYLHLSKTLSSTKDSKSMSQLKQVVHEFDAAVSKQASHSAILKRSRLLTAAVDNVIEDLEVSSKNTHLVTYESTLGILQPNKDSIRDLPLDISFKSISRSQFNSYRPQWLQEKINRAKLSTCTQVSNVIDAIEKENAILTQKCYSSNASCKNTKNQSQVNRTETPKNTIKSDINLLTPFLNRAAERNTTLYKRTPRKVVQSRLMSSSTVVDANWSAASDCDSLHLEITDILDNLSTLADTLSSETEIVSVTTPQPKASPHAAVTKRYFSGSSCDSYSFSLTSVRTSEVSDVNTLERLQDLMDLDEKIFNLKLS